MNFEDITGMLLMNATYDALDGSFPRIVRERCPYCGGSGRVAERLAQGQFRVMPCRPCAGNGHITRESN